MAAVAAWQAKAAQPCQQCANAAALGGAAAAVFHHIGSLLRWHWSGIGGGGGGPVVGHGLSIDVGCALAERHRCVVVLMSVGFQLDVLENNDHMQL